MSLFDTFDPDTPELVKAENMYERVENFPNVVIGMYSLKMQEIVRNMPGSKQISEIRSGCGTSPIYQIEHRGRSIAIYMSFIGGSMAAGSMEEVMARGGRRFLFFGSCGCLTPGISAGHIIVPEAAYRDEGTSYHYAPPSDFIEIKSADRLCEILAEMDVPFIKTRTWTTDAFYRETRGNVEKRIAAGCQVVEMECASLAAAAQYRGIEFMQFLYGADSLAGEEWDKRILGGLSGDQRTKYLEIALDIAARM